MLVLKIVFGIIVTLPILILADFLFENTVAEAVVGTSKKKKKPKGYSGNGVINE